VRRKIVSLLFSNIRDLQKAFLEVELTRTGETAKEPKKQLYRFFGPEEKAKSFSGAARGFSVFSEDVQQDVFVRYAEAGGVSQSPRGEQ
jgi:hypothetical protein